jgi:site-specific recombinase XerD
MESYLNHFKAKTNYTNEQRISIFNSEFNSELSDRKIWNIINKYFKVASARIGGKKTKYISISR